MKGLVLDKIPLNALSGIGSSLTEKLKRIGLITVQDLLFHLPLRYEDRTHIYSIAELSPTMHATIKGKILRCDIVFGRRKMMVCQISDGTGTLNLRFFNFTKAMNNNLLPGKWLKAYGEVKRGKQSVEIMHPEYRILSNETAITFDHALTPIYPTTEGLSQTLLRKITEQALDLLDRCVIPELLPFEISQEYLSLPEALHILHRPPTDTRLTELIQGKHPAQRRLIMEELLAHNLSLLAVRTLARTHRAVALATNQQLRQTLLNNLPFTPTQAQIRVVNEIEKDMNQSIPMMRLVQGDVGSGKTLVAVLTALIAIGNGKQVALMAPTELLAEQHANNFKQWLVPLGIQVGWLVGKQKGKIRQMQMDAIANGKIAMIIGTHAIFQEKVLFHDLALIIIDEQHRFGVHQRLALWEKGQKHDNYPHQLIMTATPIPRTLAMTAYADLDTSIIDELPPGRTAVTTVAIADSRRDEIVRRVQYACLYENRQAYWVCTLIEESEIFEAQAAEATCQDLKAALPQLRIGLVHGKMKPSEKQAVMQAFKQGELQLLVATTVIEVGVDVPNASLMIIENPERLGLAQLHQLRGRVGRGTIASHCVLLYKTPLSKTAQLRLQVLRDNHDGFVIAQRDLEIRGPGEVLGTRQTGITEFKVADLIRDQYLIPTVQHNARYIQKNYPDLAQALINRWLPAKVRYINA